MNATCESLPATVPFNAVANWARQALYRFAAATLADPRSGGCALLFDGGAQRFAVEATAVMREDPDFRQSELARGERPIAELNVQNILDRLPNSEAELNAIYEATFGLVEAGACTPYETEYLPAKLDFQRSNSLADIAGYYRAFGLEPSSRQRERHDHIVLELEFMASLIALERLAAEDESAAAVERRLVCREAQARFVREHLAWWVPAFARLLTLPAPHGFFAAVSPLLAALVAAERAYLGVPLPNQPPPQPSAIERPDECAGCELAGP